MNTVRSIGKRWFLKSSCFAVIMLILSPVIFGMFLKNYFYNNIRDEIEGEIAKSYNIYRGKNLESTISFESTSLEYIRQFKKDDSLKLTIFNNENKVIYSTEDKDTNDFENILDKIDYYQSLNSNDNSGFYISGNIFEERTMSETRSIYTPSTGKYLGSLRYNFYLKKTDKLILFCVIIFFISLTIIITLFIFFGAYFLKSIINPVKKISKTAIDIAKGDFNIKIKKKYDDEMGRLCDSINYMAEELSTSEKLKNEFISSISHELRTPLTAIKGWAETIQTSETPDMYTVSRGLKIIAHETERLSGIVEELLDFSKLQKNKTPVILDKVDILAELGEAVYIFKERAIHEDKVITYDEPKSISPVVGNKNRIKQVFINILDNAIKYTNQGGSISVSVREQENMVTVNITDNGCGISKEHIGNVTKKFYKANFKRRGSGIGLAVVDEIVKSHGGTLSIVSEEDVGTTVSVSFPTVL